MPWPNQNLVAPAVRRCLKAADLAEAERLDHALRADVETGYGDPEGGGRELAPPEVQTNRDSLPAPTLTRQFGTQAAAGVERRWVVNAAWHLAVCAEGAEADQPAAVDERKIAAIRADEEGWIGASHVVAVIRGGVAPRDDVSRVEVSHGHNLHGNDFMLTVNHPAWLTTHPAPYAPVDTRSSYSPPHA